ncbi:MAG TPA: polyhydroxyalkanoate synthesis regulator DNA-binding domain-containing protein [Thermoanaerobaculia bacterium]|nr:polyhydroxyalkanoate synthesis regulator DNA-binding domain-containing protein [Thermoanaerobaculia bacterium]
MSEVRLIKKYSNRRLYDTATSRYVNLDQVASLIRRGHALKVVDAKSGEDLTRQVLTQIIVEDARQPDGGAPVEFLRDMIRATDSAQRDFLEWYLAAAADTYKSFQKAWGDRVPLPAGGAAQWEAWSRLWDPVKAFQGLATKAATKATARRGDQRAEATAPAPASRARATGAPPKPAAPEKSTQPAEHELADLRQRLEALERRLAGEPE